MWGARGPKAAVVWLGGLAPDPELGLSGLISELGGLRGEAARVRPGAGALREGGCGSLQTPGLGAPARVRPVPQVSVLWAAPNSGVLLLWA